LWPRESLDLLKRLRFLPVRGNHDRWLADVERSGLRASDAFAFDRLTAAEIAELGDLPPRLQLEREIVAVPGSPRSDGEYLLENVRAGRLSPTDRARVGQRRGEVSVGVVLGGHPHQARIVP